LIRFSDFNLKEPITIVSMTPSEGTIGKIFDLFFKWFSNPWPLLLAFILSVPTWLFFSAKRLEQYGASELSEHIWLALGFFFVTWLLLIQGSVWTVTEAKTRKAGKPARQLRQIIQNLSMNERMVLRVFVERQSQTAALKKDPITTALRERGLLFERSGRDMPGGWTTYSLSDGVYFLLLSDSDLLSDTIPATESTSDSWMR